MTRPGIDEENGLLARGHQWSVSRNASEACLGGTLLDLTALRFYLYKLVDECAAMMLSVLFAHVPVCWGSSSDP